VTAELLLFWVFGSATVIGALFVVSARSPMSSAMALVATFFFLAGIYVLLWAHAIAVLQVLVYAGAIMVLFLFVIMLLSLAEVEISAPALKFSRLVGGASTLGLLAVLALALSRVPSEPPAFTPAQQASFGSLRTLGQIVYTSYLLPFEAVSLLLLVAILGAVVVAKPRI
jgi:NADH-quinone oxidoreductase subunit J